MARGISTPAKLARPASVALVARPRLFARLDRGPAVTWLCGPPGAGKSALAASWLEARRRASAWYQIDARDADLATFFYYMGVLARQIAPARRAPLPAFSAAFAGGAPTFTRRFFESFWERCPHKLVLVLDDYAALPSSAPLHEMLAELVATIPPSRRVIVIGREEPPASLARFRGSGAVAIVGGTDLALTAQEIQSIARRRVPGSAAGLDVERVARDSQGWAAGAMLLLETASGGGAAHPSATFEYFAEEVLAKLAPADSRALVALSLLPIVPAGVVVEVTGEPSAPLLLERLGRRRCFVERRETGEPVYKLHPMFRAFLREQARATLGDDERRRILSAGAAHLADAGQVDEAAAALVEGQDWKTLERLVLDQAAALVRAGRAAVVLGWLEAMPAEAVESSAWLSYWLGVGGRGRGFPFAREHLARAAGLFDAVGDVAGLAATLAAILETFVLEADRYAPMDPWLDRAAGLVESAAELPPAFAIAAFRATFLRRPDHPSLSVLRDRLHVIRGEARVAEHAIAAGLALGFYYAWMGEPLTAAALVRGAREMIGAGHDVVTLQTADYVEAVVAIKLGDGDMCEAAVRRGLERAEGTGMHALDFRFHNVGVYAARMQRDAGLVGRHLDWMLHHLDGAGLVDRCYYHHLLGWDLAIRGDVDRAYRESRLALVSAEEAGAPAMIALGEFLLAQLAGERGDAAEAASRIARVRGITEAMGSQSLLFMTEMIEADLADAQGDAAEGLRLLRRGFERARRQRLRFYSGWRPSVMTRLCTKALEASVCVEYVQGLVRHHALTPQGAALDVANWPWRLEVRTLGPLRVLVDGEELHASGRAPQRPLELLRALIAYGGRHVPPSRLTDALWPDADADSAQQALDTNLLRLRRLLGSPAFVIVDEGRISLDEGQCALDVWRLERLLDHVETALRRADADLLGRLGRAVTALYAGPFLADSERPWAVAPRERMRRRVLLALDGIGRVRESRGDHEGALASSLRALEVDDLAEALYQRALRAYVALGRHAEATALYQRCRLVLGAQLGVEPSTETRSAARLH